MGFRELLLVVFNSILFSLLIMNINATSMRSHETLEETEIAHTAISVAQRFLEEAKSKNFDASSDVLAPEDMPAGFTASCCLGNNVSETYPNFNDVDDYHGFNETITVQGMDFDVEIEVEYVQDTNPELGVGTETFFKKMTVKVSTEWLPHGIVLKQVFSYYGVNNT